MGSSNNLFDSSQTSSRPLQRIYVGGKGPNSAYLVATKNAQWAIMLDDESLAAYVSGIVINCCDGRCLFTKGLSMVHGEFELGKLYRRKLVSVTRQLIFNRMKLPSELGSIANSTRHKGSLMCIVTFWVESTRVGTQKIQCIWKGKLA
jgi:hypothetical protein